jgi:hypothetical protein
MKNAYGDKMTFNLGMKPLKVGLDKVSCSAWRQAGDSGYTQKLTDFVGKTSLSGLFPLWLFIDKLLFYKKLRLFSVNLKVVV